MTLQEQVNHDLKEAMRAKEETTLNTLRLLKSEIQYELTKTGASTVSDDVVITLLKKAISQRTESATQFRNANREDLASKEEAEREILKKYLPPDLPDSAILEAIDKAIQELSPKTQKEAGKITGNVMGKLKGKNANGTRVSELVKEKLSHLP